jgi:hypothetical protein
MANPQPSAQSTVPPTNPGNGELSALGATEDIWDEERLEKAMQTLKEMHIQVGLSI